MSKDEDTSWPSPVVHWIRETVPAVAKPPLLLLLHGLNSNEQAMVSIANYLPADFAIASVRAPLQDKQEYSWFLYNGIIYPDSESLQASIGWFRHWLDTMPEPAFDPARVFLLGFSGGSTMAGALALSDPKRWAGLILLSGTLPFETTLPMEAGRLNGVPVFLAHGSLDLVIPAELVSRTWSYLQEESGAELTSQLYNFDHLMGFQELKDVNKWLAAHLI